MKWKELFKPVESMDAEGLRAYVAKHREGDYTLLDVRQLREYEESRIPGATLIPLPQLSDRLDEVDPEKPVVVYCAIGGRSRAAAQLLAGEGFGEVYNLKGGIKAWNGLTAEGPVDFAGESRAGDMSLHDVLSFALGMEKGLALFYLTVAGETGDKEMADLLRRLAGFEEKHQEKILELYQSMDPHGESRKEAVAETTSSLMEGGFSVDEFLKENRSRMTSSAEILSLAMMLEAQALDLYRRFSGYMESEKSRRLLHQIADDEKAHLKALGEMIDAASSCLKAFFKVHGGRG